MTEKLTAEILNEGYNAEVGLRLESFYVTGVITANTMGGAEEPYVDGQEIEVTEIFAEGVWGKSYNGFGEKRRVKIEELDIVVLRDTERITDEALKQQVIEHFC
jgi:hypothetical protein